MYQRLVTYAAGKFEAATDVVEMAKSTPTGLRGRVESEVPLLCLEPLLPGIEFSMVALGDAASGRDEPPTTTRRAEEKARPSARAYEPASRRHFASRPSEGRGPLRCYTCWEWDHLAHR